MPTQEPVVPAGAHTATAGVMTSRASSNGTAMDEVEEVFRVLRGQERVVGVIATTADGAPIKSTLEDDAETSRYAQLAAGLCDQARSAMSDAGPGEEPTFFKMKTRRHEVVISPSKKYTLVVLTEVPQPPAEAGQ